MKSFLPLCLFIFSFTLLNAQDWKPFNVGRTYQYKNNTDAKYYTFRVESSAVNEGKTFLYFDKKRMLDKYDYTGGYFGSQVITNYTGDTAQFVVVKYPFDRTVLLLDTLLLRLKAKVGETWKFSASENIRLAKKETREIFAGDIDSVQVFVTSQSDSIWLSKKYGIVKARYFDKNWGSDYLTLDAIKELDKGLFLPDLRRMYDFEVGDIFITNYSIIRSNRTCPSSRGYAVDTILGKQISANKDTVWYTLNNNDRMSVTALSVYTTYLTKQITELTSKTSQFTRELETEIYADSLIATIAGMEDVVENRYAVGLGNTFYYVNTIFGLCAYEEERQKLICWKTSKSESPDFSQCLSTILSIEGGEDFSAAKVYPNPAQDLLSIELPQVASEVQLNVYDLLGNKCMEQKINAAHSTLDVSSLANGIYHLSLRANQKNFQRTFVKQ